MSKNTRKIRRNRRKFLIMDKLLRRGKAEFWPKILLGLYFLGQIGAAIAGFTEKGKSPTLERLEVLQFYGIFMALFGIIGVVSLARMPKVTAICLYMISFFTLLQGLALMGTSGVTQTAIKVTVGPFVGVVAGYVWWRYSSVVNAILSHPASRGKGKLNE